MGLERLAPLGPEGGEPPARTTGNPPARTTGGAPSRTSGSPRAQQKRRRFPTREERDAAAERTQQARQDAVDADPVGIARQICLQQLEAAPRTRAELAKALAKRGVPEGAANEVLGRFEEVGIIDDALFASLWVTSRHRGRGLAGRALSQELRRKGVDDETVREAVAELDPDEEVETARVLVRRKLGGTRSLPTEARVRRLAGMLARKGYGPGVAFRIVKEELAAEGTDVPHLTEPMLVSDEVDGLAALE